MKMASSTSKRNNYSSIPINNTNPMVFKDDLYESESSSILLPSLSNFSPQSLIETNKSRSVKQSLVQKFRALDLSNAIDSGLNLDAISVSHSILSIEKRMSRRPLLKNMNDLLSTTNSSSSALLYVKEQDNSSSIQDLVNLAGSAKTNSFEEENPSLNLIVKNNQNMAPINNRIESILDSQSSTISTNLCSDQNDSLNELILKGRMPQKIFQLDLFSIISDRNYKKQSNNLFFEKLEDQAESKVLKSTKYDKNNKNISTCNSDYINREKQLILRDNLTEVCEHDLSKLGYIVLDKDRSMMFCPVCSNDMNIC